LALFGGYGCASRQLRWRSKHDFSRQPYSNLIEIAWAGRLMLVLTALGLSLAAQYNRSTFTGDGSSTAVDWYSPFGQSGGTLKRFIREA
jgi:hypothetical protein